MNTYDEKHLPKETTALIKNGALDKKDLMRALDHLSRCDDCRAAFAESFKPAELKTPLSPLNAEIMYKIKNKNNKRHILAYEFKVALAVCASLMMLMIMPQNISVSGSFTCIQKSWQGITKPIEMIKEQLAQLSDQFYEGGIFIEETKK